MGDNTIKKIVLKQGYKGNWKRIGDILKNCMQKLFYNQGGAIKIGKLTKQQKKDIQKQQPIPQPESSVKEPFEDVKRRKIEDEEIFKKPKDGVRPPQKVVPKENKVQEWKEEQSKAKYQPEPVTERYTSPMKEFEKSEKEQRKMTPSPKGQRIPRKQTCPRKSIGTLEEDEIEEEEESFRRQKYQKSTASQVGIGSLENLSQKIEKPPTTPQSKGISPKQGLVEDIIEIKPMTSDQPIIQTPPRPENRDSKEYEPIYEKLMREREKQVEEFLKKVPIPDHREQYPYSQGVNQERNLDDQATSPKVLIKSPMREERVTTPRERGDHGKPIGASPHTQVKTRYEVEMDERRRIGSTEKKGQSTYRWTYPSQPPPPPPPTGGGAGGHRRWRRRR